MTNIIGAVSCHLQFETPREAFEQAAAYGLDAIEWFESGEARWTTAEYAPVIRRMAGEFGVCAAYHAPYIGAWSLAQADRDSARAVARDILERARRLDAGTVTLHIGTCPEGVERRTAIENAIEGLAAVLDDARRSGIRFVIENFTKCHNPRDLGDTVEDLAPFFDVFPEDVVGWTLDTGHAAITGNLDAMFTAFGTRLGNLHLHDSDGRTDGHLPPGNGVFDWQDLFRRLRSMAYQGPVTLEFPERSGRYPPFIKRLRMLHG